MSNRINQKWIDDKIELVNKYLKDKKIDLEICQKMNMLGYKYPLSAHKDKSGYQDVIYGTISKWEQYTCLKGMQLVLESLGE